MEICRADKARHQEKKKRHRETESKTSNMKSKTATYRSRISCVPSHGNPVSLNYGIIYTMLKPYTWHTLKSLYKLRLHASSWHKRRLNRDTKIHNAVLTAKRLARATHLCQVANRQHSRRKHRRRCRCRCGRHRRRRRRYRPLCRRLRLQQWR